MNVSFVIGLSFPVAVSREIFYHVLERQRVFHVVEAVHEVDAFETLQIAVCLCRAERMRGGKLAYHGNEIGHFVFDFRIYCAAFYAFHTKVRKVSNNRQGLGREF